MQRLVGLVVVIGLLASGCAGDGGAAETTTSTPPTITTLPPVTDAPTTTEAATTTAPATTTTTTTTLDLPAEPVIVYLLGETTTGEPGPFLVPVSRLAEGAEPDDLETAIRSLLAGLLPAEAEAGLSTAVPEGSTLIGLTASQGVAIIDLGSEFEDGGPGGSFSVMAKLAQLVWTVTRHPDVTGVRLLIEGEAIEYFSSEGLEIGYNLTRADFTELRPAILVDEPAWGSAVEVPFTVAGIASVFEATVQWELRDGDGAAITTGFFTALDSVPAWGAFGGEIAADVSGPGGEPVNGSLVVWEDAAEAGGHIWEMVYPVTLADPP
jgi:spore germination protein GerM